MASNFVFADTSFFKAYIDQKDIFHPQALKILKQLKKTGAILITSNYILDETYTLLRTHCELKDAVDFHDGLGSGLLNVSLFRIEIDDEILAWKLFNEPWRVSPRIDPSTTRQEYSGVVALLLLNNE